MSLKYEVYRNYNNNLLFYSRHGVKHRDNGPANMWHDGYTVWYQYGKKHRLDGPAEICYGGPSYYLQGWCYTREEYESKIRNSTDDRPYRL